MIAGFTPLLKALKKQNGVDQGVKSEANSMTHQGE